MARAALPNEACGLIGGTTTDGGWHAASVHPVKNTLASPTAFALDGAAMIDAENRIDDAGNELLGVWHSHPSAEAVPSPTDLADAARYDPHGVLLQVLVSMQGFAPQVRAYRYGPADHAVTTADPGDYSDVGEPLRKYWLVRLGS